MGVYIEGMEMPKTCNECRFAIDSYCYAVVRYKHLSGGGRANWCPLIEVPPHGRLIDADALEDEGADVHEDVMCCGYVEDAIWGFSHDMIHNAPTVIPASEEGE